MRGVYLSKATHKRLGHFGDRFGGPLAEMPNYTIHLDHMKRPSRCADVLTEFFCKNFSCLQEKKKHSPTRSVKSTQTLLKPVRYISRISKPEICRGRRPGFGKLAPNCQKR